MSGIPAWARPGAKVVCVSDGGHEERDGVVRPRAGREYTIRKAAVIGGEAGCWLEEIRNPVLIGTYEPGWTFDHFLPVIPYPG